MCLFEQIYNFGSTYLPTRVRFTSGNVDMTNELVRHFLIESTKKGVRLRGKENEPIFGKFI